MKNEAQQEYFEKRSLKQGTVGWVLLTGLGVSYVISGDFSGWNYGIANGGWLGLCIAFVAMGLMYGCTVFGIAELSSALPTAGAGYGFARRALGKTGGFVTGLAVLIPRGGLGDLDALVASHRRRALGLGGEARRSLDGKGSRHRRQDHEEAQGQREKPIPPPLF